MNAVQDPDSPRGPWILLTDDSPTVCTMLTRLATQMGYQTRELHNFLELPRLLRTNPPRVVVLDLERPGGLSGPAIGRFIRQYESQRIPIIVFSSLPNDVRNNICREISAEATLGKQENINELGVIIRRLVERSGSSLH